MSVGGGAPVEEVSVGGGASVDVVGVVASDVLLSEKQGIIMVKMDPTKLVVSMELLFDNKEHPGT